MSPKNLHIECENWPEAGFTLRKQVAKLRWTDEPLNPRLHHTNHPECVIHRDLKVVLSHGWWLDIRSNLTRWCSTDRWLSYSQRVRCGSIEQCRAL